MCCDGATGFLQAPVCLQNCTDCLFRVNVIEHRSLIIELSPAPLSSFIFPEKYFLYKNWTECLIEFSVLILKT